MHAINKTSCTSKCVIMYSQDSFESKTSNAAATEMGSTSYIIPLRSESDEDYEPLPQPHAEPVAFRNRVAPTQPAVRPEPITRLVKSRSPLFRAKSGDHDDGSPESAKGPATGHAATSLTGAIVNSESNAAAKMKRSIFSNKSNSAGASGGEGTVDRRPSKPSRSTSSAKTDKNSEWPENVCLSRCPSAFLNFPGNCVDTIVDPAEFRT